MLYQRANANSRCATFLAHVGLEVKPPQNQVRNEAISPLTPYEPNPFVPLREEAELALRLRRAGYRLYRLPGLIANHYSPPRQTMREIGRRYRAGYYVGFGRALYYANRSGLGWQFVREQGLAYLTFAVYVLSGIASLLCLFFGQRWQLVILWVALTAIILVAYAIKKGSLREALFGFISRGLIVYGSVVGVLSAWRDPPDYPTDVSVIKP